MVSTKLIWPPNCMPSTTETRTNRRNHPFPCVLAALAVILFLLIPLQTSIASRTPEWQQSVRYQMDLTLDESTRSIGGDAHITYTNNSPDTLGTLWFRLAPAALQGGSVVDTIAMRGRHAHWTRQAPETWGDLHVGIVQARDMRQVTFEQDFSIGQLQIDPPLLPGDSVGFTLPFVTTLPTGGSQSRMGYTQGQFKGAYWYPLICPYTPEFGWTVNRYFGTAEAYGEFADYTINYTVPYKYIIASTGELINEAEVLPPERLHGLSLDNPDPIRVPIGEKADSLVTWTFQANQVPDVAFAMDPNFLIDRIDFGHFEAWSFSRRDSDDDWSNAAEVAGWTIIELEKIYGKYPWPRVQASYSWSAMEYPMLTLMTSSNPRFVQVMIHEVVHNYTPMILQSNSVDEQWIDEGFTTFLEHHLLEKYEGTVYNKYRTYTRGLFSKEMIVRDDDVRGRRPYLEAVLAGEDLPMVRASDTADDYPLLRVSSYYKTPVMLNTLRSVIGEDAFWRGFRILYERHALTHVSGDDIVSSFEDASGRSLKWFFDQFMYSADDLDYALRNVEQVIDAQGARFEFDVERVGGIRLPITLGIVSEAGDTLKGVIPFLPTDKILPGYEVWGTWDQLHMPNNRIHLEIELPTSAKRRTIMLDPDGLWTDRNPDDNMSPRNDPELVFDPVFVPIELKPVDRWQATFSPTVGYNQATSVMAGIATRGSYIDLADIWMFDFLLPYEGFQDYLPQARFGFARQLNRNFGPTYATLYAGQMHGDGWAEAGLLRSWRSWSSWFQRGTVSMKVGFWDRDASRLAATLSAPAAVYNSKTGRYSQASAVPQSRGSINHASQDLGTAYLRFKAEFSGSGYRNSWTHHFHWTVGLDPSYQVATWWYDKQKQVNYGWTLGVETRSVISANDPPARFIDSAGGGSAYDLLGNPLFGGSWTASGHRQHVSDIPRPYSPASLSSILGTTESNFFIIHRLSQSHKLPGFMRKTGQVHVDRFLNCLRIGLFEAGYILDNGLDPVSFAGVEDLEISADFGAEAGVEIQLKDLYGVTMSARFAPVYTSRRSYNSSFEELENWTGDEWWDNVVIYVNLDLDPYFR